MFGWKPDDGRGGSAADAVGDENEIENGKEKREKEKNLTQSARRYAHRAHRDRRGTA